MNKTKRTSICLLLRLKQNFCCLYQFEKLLVTCICFNVIRWIPLFRVFGMHLVGFSLASIPYKIHKSGEKALFTTILHVTCIHSKYISAKTIHFVCTDLLVIPECKQPRKHWSTTSMRTKDTQHREREPHTRSERDALNRAYTQWQSYNNWINRDGIKSVIAL